MRKVSEKDYLFVSVVAGRFSCSFSVDFFISNRTLPGVVTLVDDKLLVPIHCRTVAVAVLKNISSIENISKLSNVWLVSLSILFSNTNKAGSE